MLKFIWVLIFILTSLFPGHLVYFSLDISVWSYDFTLPYLEEPNMSCTSSMDSSANMLSSFVCSAYCAPHTMLRSTVDIYDSSHNVTWLPRRCTVSTYANNSSQLCLVLFAAKQELLGQPSVFAGKEDTWKDCWVPSSFFFFVSDKTLQKKNTRNWFKPGKAAQSLYSMTWSKLGSL